MSRQWHWSYPGSNGDLYLFGFSCETEWGCVCVRTRTRAHYTYIYREGGRWRSSGGRERKTDRQRFILRNWLTWLWSLCLCIDPMDCSLPGSPVHGIFFQARILEWVAISFPRESSPPRDQTHVSWITGEFFTTEPLGKPSCGVWWVPNLQGSPEAGNS